MASDQHPPVQTLLCGMGAATPVGRGAWATAAAVRAGISGFAQHPFMVDAAGEPMQVAGCPWLQGALEGEQRMQHCLLLAVREALAPIAAAITAGTQPPATLLLGLPAPRPGLAPGLDARLEAGLQAALPGVFERVVRVSKGHACGLLSVHAARKALLANPFDAFVVAAVDSWLDPDTLEWLEETEQLHGAGPRNNAWGFVPGEGAGAVLLLSQAGAQRHGLQPLARIAGSGIGTEHKLIRSGQVCLGEGLTHAITQALASLDPGSRVSDVYCDMNGEPYRADEYGFTVVRMAERFRCASDFVAAADCFGDVGAASGPLAMVLAAAAHLKGYAKGRTSLVWASSDAGERGAALLAAPAQP